MSSKFGGWVRGKFVSPAFFATRVPRYSVISAPSPIGLALGSSEFSPSSSLYFLEQQQSKYQHVQLPTQLPTQLPLLVSLLASKHASKHASCDVFKHALFAP